MNPPRILRVLCWALFAIVLVRTAWVCDDAYITFRSIDNAVHGHGLTYNPDERVQAYTHPLWMMVHLPFQALAGDPWWVTLVLSMGLSLVGLWHAARTTGAEMGWVAFPLLAVASKAWTEFSTSGLENPLSHLLLIAFVAKWWGEGRRRIFWLSFLVGLILMNRMDLALLVLPAWGIAVWRAARGSRASSGWGVGLCPALGGVGLGLLPFLLWESFAVFYYGFPFPNTAYAKLGMGIPQSELFAMGLRYFGDSLRRDPVTLPLILVGLACGIARRRYLPLVLGVALYLVYILRIGGDFMSGRFFTAPLAVSLLVMGRVLIDQKWALGGIAAAASVLAFLGPTPMVLSGAGYNLSREEIMGPHGIADERAFYYHGTGLLHAFAGRDMPDFRWVQAGKDLREAPDSIVIESALGMKGYYAGPHRHLVDLMALSDPLLARLPARDAPQPRPGHYQRLLPKGYVPSIRRDTNLLMDPVLRICYDDLRLITRGTLLAPGRWAAMWRQNFHPPAHADLQSYRLPLEEPVW